MGLQFIAVGIQIPNIFCIGMVQIYDVIWIPNNCVWYADNFSLLDDLNTEQKIWILNGATI